MNQHAQLVYLWAGSSEAPPQRKPSLPSKVTNSKKGPLSLYTPRRRSTFPASGSHPVSRLPTIQSVHDHTHHPHRRNILTKFPVTLLERPIEAVEKQLGTLSCAQLKDTVQEWLPTSSPHRNKLPQLPPREIPHGYPHHGHKTTPPYYPQHNRRHSKIPMEVKVDGNLAPMDITISYSKHRHALSDVVTPFNSPAAKPNALTNLTVLSESATPTAPPTRNSREGKKLYHSWPHSVPLSYRQASCLTLPSQLAQGSIATPAGMGGRMQQRLQPLTILKGKGLPITHRTDAHHLDTSPNHNHS